MRNMKKDDDTNKCNVTTTEKYLKCQILEYNNNIYMNNNTHGCNVI